jgi:Fe-S-cluster containining protein
VSKRAGGVGSDGLSRLRFECTECGECCTNRGEYAYVYVDDDEVRWIAELLGISQALVRRRHTFIDDDGLRQIAFLRDRCTFLEPGTQRCRIYAARPSQCRTFPVWPELISRGRWTAEARRLCEGVGNGPRFSRAEVAARLAEVRRRDET